MNVMVVPPDTGELQRDLPNALVSDALAEGRGEAHPAAGGMEVAVLPYRGARDPEWPHGRHGGYL